jgi:hypothetical protein
LITDRAAGILTQYAPGTNCSWYIQYPFSEPDQYGAAVFLNVSTLDLEQGFDTLVVSAGGAGIVSIERVGISFGSAPLAVSLPLTLTGQLHFGWMVFRINTTGPPALRTVQLHFQTDDNKQGSGFRVSYDWLCYHAGGSNRSNSTDESVAALVERFEWVLAIVLLCICCCTLLAVWYARRKGCCLCGRDSSGGVSSKHHKLMDDEEGAGEGGLAMGVVGTHTSVSAEPAPAYVPAVQADEALVGQGRA